MAEESTYLEEYIAKKRAEEAEIKKIRDAEREAELQREYDQREANSPLAQEEKRVAEELANMAKTMQDDLWYFTFKYDGKEFRVDENIDESLYPDKQDIEDNKDMINGALFFLNEAANQMSIPSGFSFKLNFNFYPETEQPDEFELSRTSTDHVKCLRRKGQTNLLLPFQTFHRVVSESMTYEDYVRVAIQEGDQPWSKDECHWAGPLAYEGQQDLVAKCHAIPNVSAVLDEQGHPPHEHHPFHLAQYRMFLDMKGKCYCGISCHKLLLWMKRPVIILDYGWQEFYSHNLKSGQHCIIINSVDQLEEEVDRLRNDQQWYDKIAQGGREFAETYFNHEYIINYTKETLRKMI